jgi:hypothetical protein
LNQLSVSNGHIVKHSGCPFKDDTRHHQTICLWAKDASCGDDTNDTLWQFFSSGVKKYTSQIYQLASSLKSLLGLDPLGLSDGKVPKSSWFIISLPIEGHMAMVDATTGDKS